MAQQFKLLAVLVFHMIASLSLSISASDLVPPNVPRKVQKYGPNSWALATYVIVSYSVSGSWFQPVPVPLL